jgi:hypothetical protein
MRLGGPFDVKDWFRFRFRFMEDRESNDAASAEKTMASTGMQENSEEGGDRIST